MSLCVPPECLEFIRTCTTLEVQWGYFFFGLIIGLGIGLVFALLHITRNLIE